VFHALVAVKQVPDTTNIRIDPETGNLIRQGVPTILNPYDAHALAAAVEWKQKLGGKITVISMGPPSTVTTIRECIEMGADRGIIITARQFAGADTLATSYVLATLMQVVHEQDPVSVVLFGKQAIDGDTAQVGPGVSIRMGLPLVTYAVKIHDINLEEKYMVAERKTEAYNEIIRTPLPAGLTCEKEIAKIPYASLPNLVYSLKYEPEIWTHETPVMFPLDQIGLKGSPTWVFKTTQPELRKGGEVFKVIEVGVGPAVKSVLDQVKSSGVLSAVSGGAA
jgi:electron transfer flavoprotein beta subunit